MTLDRVQNSFYDPDDGSLEVVTVEGVQGQVAGGASFAIGSSFLIAQGEAQPAIACGSSSTKIVYATVQLTGTDIQVSVDGTTITILTAGWYQVTAYNGNNGSAITSFQTTISFPDADLYGNFDNYVGCDPTVGGVDLIVPTPFLPFAAGDTMFVEGYADGTGTWNLEGNPNQIYVVRGA